MPSTPVEELKIPTPYGFLAARAWGPSNGFPIMSLHGWQENAASFNTLIPLLPSELRVVAMDLPGHGLSSHLPHCCPYDEFTYLIEIKRAIDFLGWKKFVFMSHSLGASLSMLYASSFPSQVIAVISFDMIKPLSFPAPEVASRTASAIQLCLKFESQMGSRGPPAYSETEAIQKLKEAYGGSVNESGVKILMTRGTRSVEDGSGRLIFTRDPRIRMSVLHRMSDRGIMDYLSTLKCEVLILRATDCLNLDEPSTVEKVKNMLQAQCKRFKYVDIPGNHHMHLNTPENVVPEVISFLKEILDKQAFESKRSEQKGS